MTLVCKSASAESTASAATIARIAGFTRTIYADASVLSRLPMGTSVLIVGVLSVIEMLQQPCLATGFLPLGSLSAVM